VLLVKWKWVTGPAIPLCCCRVALVRGAGFHDTPNSLIGRPRSGAWRTDSDLGELVLRRSRRRDVHSSYAKHGVATPPASQTPAILTRLTFADRKSLLLGTALASTLLIGTLLVPPRAAAAILTCAGDVGTGPAPISHSNTDPIICLNTESGTATLVSQDAIYLATGASGAYIDLTNTATGTLTSNYRDGIGTRTSNGNSPTSINNAATISAVYDGIFAYAQSYSSPISITNSGDVTVTNTVFHAYGISAIAIAIYSPISIVNSGRLNVTAAGAGISALTYAPGSNIAILNQGPVEATTDAIFARSVYGDIVVNNSAALTAGRFGIYVNGYLNVSVTNSGPITASLAAPYFDAIYVVSFGGAVTVDNSGLLKAANGITVQSGAFVNTQGPGHQ
jgi:hypothetical protein